MKRLFLSYHFTIIDKKSATLISSGFDNGFIDIDHEIKELDDVLNLQQNVINTLQDIVGNDKNPDELDKVAINVVILNYQYVPIVVKKKHEHEE